MSRRTKLHPEILSLGKQYAVLNREREATKETEKPTTESTTSTPSDKFAEYQPIFTYTGPLARSSTCTGRLRIMLKSVSSCQTDTANRQHAKHNFEHPSLCSVLYAHRHRALSLRPLSTLYVSATTDVRLLLIPAACRARIEAFLF